MKNRLLSYLCILIPLFGTSSCSFNRLAVYPAALTKPMPAGTSSRQEASQTGLIDFGKYEGGILIGKENKWYLSGSELPVLADGDYTIDVARISQSAFTFTVKGGRVKGTDGHEAATVTSDGILKLNTVPVTIDPGAYGKAGGRCFLPSHFDSSVSPAGRLWITESKTFDLMPGLVYAIDNGCTVGGPTGASYFVFIVKGDGTVWPCPSVLRPSPYMAQGCGCTLKLNAGRVKITPLNNDTQTYAVGSTGGYSGVQEAPVILGLTTMLQRKGGAAAYFIPYYGNQIRGKVSSGGVAYEWQVVP